MKFHPMWYAFLVMMLTLFLSNTTVSSEDDLLGKLMYKVLTVEERMDHLETQFQSAFDGLNARLDKMTDLLSTKSPAMDSEVSDMEEAITTAVAKIVQSQYTVLRNFMKEEKTVLSETKHHLQANVTNLNTVIEQALLIYDEKSEKQVKLYARKVQEMSTGFYEMLKQSALQTESELDKQDRKIQDLSKSAAIVKSQVTGHGHQLSENSNQLSTTQRNLHIYQSSCSSVSTRVDALENKADDVESQVTRQGHQLSEHSNQLSTTQRNLSVFQSSCSSVSDRVNALENKADDVESQAASQGQQLSEHSNQLSATQRNLRVYQSSCSSVSVRVDALEDKAGSFVSFSTRLANIMPETPSETIIKFYEVINNYGSHYSSSTGKFTAPVSGIYVFIFFIASDSKKAHVGLYVNGSLKTTAISDCITGGDNDTGGNSVIVQIVKGQEVYIKTLSWPDLDYYYWKMDSPDKHDIWAWKTTFSGALLHAI